MHPYSSDDSRATSGAPPVEVKTCSILRDGKQYSFTVPTSWEPLQLLGSGAYACVASFNCPTGKLAVKKVEGVLDNPVVALTTLREVRLLTHFRHPNLLCIQELFLDRPNFKDAYLCLECMDGDLHNLIRGEKPLRQQQVKVVLYQLLRGLLCLRYAHVIHRDLKPGNILLTSKGGVKIGDLGLARGIDCNSDNHDSALLTEYVVTRFYRAPEVALTPSMYTYAVDMWSTGCILGEMLTRNPLFPGKDALDQVKTIISAIGQQSSEDISWIPSSSSAWKFVQICNRSSPPSGSGLRLPGLEDLEASERDLLERLLRFDPYKRMSVEEALDHGYLELFQPATDPEIAMAKAVSRMDWSFDTELCFNSSGEPRPFKVATFRSALLEATAEVGRASALMKAAGNESVQFV
eukprot:TRINITY_DN17055_c0_g1_i1.p1 TRINITY_DN17055_c0_g1~~TRINITY_DN17055_c0_g1_i1.p1  ORF type:complete len:407 (-),score=58.44 TRINITY_DN17055_c0_g1_i1:518-1738(-)